MKNTDEALAKILNSLADKFGTTVEHLHAIMIKQALIDGVECIAAIVILISITVPLLVKMLKSKKKYDAENTRYSESYFETNILFSVLMLILTCCTIITFFVAGTNAIDALLNPEYYALHEILKAK